METDLVLTRHELAGELWRYAQWLRSQAMKTEAVIGHQVPGAGNTIAMLNRRAQRLEHTSAFLQECDAPLL